ncbi:hypothetical protein FZ983_27755 [Azospirillum sp. B21]|uniref:hypothetical protein n=1 Tax=Azospirillum sp. B21 TaxID=2607496 RepID=UPI0011EC9DAD|nr:hypothetical protein [Azospirillum sp. B21]KAA0574341.1 hypothetical protein FZ983_27755 [Azospirillum sp. B21]
MTMLICPDCHGWRRHSSDRFCGHCGRSFIVLTARATPQYTYAGQPNAHPSVLTVMLTNDGPVDPAGTVIVLIDRASEQELYRRELPDGLLSTRGDCMDCDIPLPPSVVATPLWKGRIEHRIPGRDDRRTLCDLDFGLSDPMLALAEDTVEPVLLSQEQATVPIRLQLRAGALAPIEHIDVDMEAISGWDAPPLVQLPPIPSRLAAGDDFQASLVLKGSHIGRLRLMPGGMRVMLAIRLRNRGEPIRLPLLMRFKTPAKPEFSIPNRITGLNGRTARLPITLTNHGGTACTLHTLEARLNAGSERIAGTLEFTGADAALEPGEERTVVLPLSLRLGNGGMLAPRTYFCEVELGFLDEGFSVPKRTVAVEVRPVQPFNGYIAIDFGTSATAVAYLRHDEAGPPRVLSLEPTDAFVPTTIAYAYDADANTLTRYIGNEARRRAESPNGASIIVLDNLKWRIGTAEMLSLPNGDSVSWIDIAADYLQMLKERIEEHPSIAASVERAYPTRPARFSSPATAGLFAAFRKAGMAPMGIGSGGGREVLVSESWSPLILAQPLPHLEAVQKDALDGSVLGSSFVGTHHVLTYDVGGGSTDLSMFTIEVADRSRIAVREVATDGSVVLCGNGIAALLFRHLSISLDLWFQKRGIQRFRVPIHLPWDEIPPGGVNATAARNGRAVARLLRSLQNGYKGGPFLTMLSAFVQQFGEGHPIDPADEAVVKWLSTYQGSILAAEMLDGAPLALVTVDGETLEIHWGPEGLGLDLPGFVADFWASMATPMRQTLSNVLPSDGPRGQVLHVLVSGRGSLFPLVRQMIRGHVAAALGKRAHDLRFIDTEFLKNITSLGALYLAELVLNTTGMQFRSEASTLFGILGDLDLRSGRRRFLKLCDGYPTPSDGICAVHRPLPPGNLDRRVELGVATREGDLEESRFRQEYVVSNRVELTVQQSENLHVLIEARREHCLTVSLGWPAPDGDVNDPSTFEMVELGSIALVAGACSAGASGEECE